MDTWKKVKNVRNREESQDRVYIHTTYSVAQIKWPSTVHVLLEDKISSMALSILHINSLWVHVHFVSNVNTPMAGYCYPYLIHSLTEPLKWRKLP
jgi:hypothetical protein